MTNDWCELPVVSVISRCGCGCPTIDLGVAGRCAAPSSPSAILSEAGGVSPEGTRFGVILHARDGLLSELEVYSVASAEAAFKLPDLEEIEFFGE